MNPELSQLIRLQGTELEIARLQKTIQELPEQIEQLDTTLEAAQEQLEAAKQHFEETGSERRRLESEVEDLQQKLAKYKTQLMEVKSNKEYQAMLHEIAGVEGRISDREDRILENMLEADEHQSKLSQARETLKRKEAEIAKKRRQLKSAAAKARKEIKGLEGSIQGLSDSIPQNLMAQYRRLAGHLNGVALAEARNQSCTECHVRLRPQVFSDVSMNRTILRCESCGRILYYIPPKKAASEESKEPAVQ